MKGENAHEPLRFIRENPCSSVAQKHPSSVLIRGSAKPASRGTSPLTPGPSPLPGARGAMRDFHCTSKTQIPPLAPNGGEGSGVRGQHTPQNATQQQTPQLQHSACPFAASREPNSRPGALLQTAKRNATNPRTAAFVFIRGNPPRKPPTVLRFPLLSLPFRPLCTCFSSLIQCEYHGP